LATHPAALPKIMGILNVTPDSFSDAHTTHGAIAAGRAMIASGADIIDIGGESTRPGAAPVPPEVEQARILPVIAALAGAGIPLSVDTRNAATMAAALDAGASMINDVSGLSHDPEAAALVASRACPVVLMHMRGTPRTMSAQTTYENLLPDVAAELARRVEAALAAGVRPENITLDPGIGFAKTQAQNLILLRGLQSVTALGYPVLVGASRKSFIGRYGAEPDPARRLPGSLAAALFAAAQGANILRVHDVAETLQALRVWQALAGCDTQHPPLADRPE
jgi:dihydropteroate synthase